MSHRTKDGYLVPDELYLAGKAHQAGGNTALLALFNIGNGSCSNCGGAERVGLRLLFGQGSRYIGEKGAHTWHEGLWYRSQMLSYPCPVCNSHSHQDAIQARLELSGLEESEYNWQLNYVSGQSGKDAAYKTICAIVADTRRPVGWAFLFGDYGVGKSGLLKSAVASMCRAGVAARYLTAEDMLVEVYDLIERNKRNDDEAETMRQLIARYEKYQLLAIDELGPDRAPDTQFALGKLFNIIDTRYNRRTTLATLLASNQSPDQLAAHPQWRYLESRTRDGLRVPVSGQSLRGIQ